MAHVVRNQSKPICNAPISPSKRQKERKDMYTLVIVKLNGLFFVLSPPFPQIDIIGDVVIV